MNGVVANDQELVELSIARNELFPKKSGKPISPTTLWRWIKKGVSGVCLEVRYVGSIPYTSRDMVKRFVDGVTEARRQKPVASPDQVTDEELRAAGLN